MSFMVWIIEELERAEEFFYDAYQEVKGWIWPFYLLKYPLYGLYGVFKWLVEGFYEFYQWLDWAADRIDEILSWTNIRSLIRSWLYGIESALAWFRSWTTFVGQYIDDWWTGILPYILTYVDNAVGGLVDLAAIWDNFWTVSWPALLEDLEVIRENWSSFWSVTFPTLVSFTWLTTWWNSRLLEIQDLINTALLDLEGSLAGWQEIRDAVFEFFADPLEWLWTRFTNWFLGPEV